LVALQGGRQWAKAEAAVAEMRLSGFPPSAMTYTTLVAGCAENNDVPRARALLKEMAAEGVMPNTFTFTALIAACVRGGDWQAALEVFQDMHMAGVPANTVDTYDELCFMMNYVFATMQGFAYGIPRFIHGGVAAPQGVFDSGHWPARRVKSSFRQLIKDVQKVARLGSNVLLLLKHRLQKLLCSSFLSTYRRKRREKYYLRNSAPKALF
jgi:pentatricopeptide repeat protein